MSLLDLLSNLKDNPSGHIFTVAPVPESANTYLGVDQAGRPWLFIRAQERSHDAPLRTAQITLFPAQEYSISFAGSGVRTETFHALRCDASNPADVGNFLILVEAFLANNKGKHIGDEALGSFFRSMVRLFSIEPARDLTAERQGLWGELFFMKQIRGYAFWAPFWHSEITRLFDFSSSHDRVEVKTTIGTQRVHHFSHRQVYALEGEEIVIASLLLREDDAGRTLQDLVDECRASLLGTPHYLKLEKAVRRAGMDDPSIAGPAYDASQALESFAMFKSTEAPHFRMSEPPGVSETHYKVDLSAAPRLSKADIDSWLNIWLTAKVVQAVSQRMQG
jgi:hypothetical protein